jgi:glutathione synthase
MIHILLIDPLEKLSIKKDTTIQLALTMKQQGLEVYFLFEENLYFSNNQNVELECYSFFGKLDESAIAPESCTLGEKKKIEINEKVNLHMRLDPPFDSRYLRILWILSAIEQRTNCSVTNGANAIAVNNEKLISYMASDAVESYVGGSTSGFLSFCEGLKKQGHEEIVIKPLDLYQGIGVEKVNLSDDLTAIFKNRTEEFGGALVAQPFLEGVMNGEVRSVYYAGVHLGSIIKTPKKGDFISNIAYGATYMAYQLSDSEKELCDREAKKLFENDLPWVAFDLLDGKIQEMNITCPGLLVEVSKANNKNLCLNLIDLLKEG